MPENVGHDRHRSINDEAGILRLGADERHQRRVIPLICAAQR